MGFRSTIKKILKSVLAKYDLDLVSKSLIYDWQIEEININQREVLVPEGAIEYLIPSNPQLLAYQDRYKKCNYPSSEVLKWTPELVNDMDILNFRGHNAYVFQEGSCNRNLFGYLLAYYYVKSVDKHGFLDIFNEDNAFGAITYGFDGRLISRDLLDSILEINFLERNLGLLKRKSLTVLDIGAGYGRLAYRMCKAIPNISSYYCTDAVPLSTFIADYYLKFRGVNANAKVLPLDRIEKQMEDEPIDLALNIHSFSECKLVAIEWWLEILNRYQVPYLMIVPNSGKELFTNDQMDFKPLVQRYGYELMALESKYQDPIVQKYALNPDHYHLYKSK